MFIGTTLANMGDASIKGTLSRGEEQWCSKLTPESVSVIREDYQNGVSQRTIAARFGIDQTNVSHIVLRKSWKHVD